MKLKLLRKYKKETYTIGELYIDGKLFCSTLEDKDRGLSSETPLSEIKKIKVPNETAIPTGTYKIILNKSPKFGRILPRLLDVPGFEGILIHRGNTNKDTSGCILIGENKVVGKVINSTSYELKLVDILSKKQIMSEDIEIEIQ